jgi:hypothetical protein
MITKEETFLQLALDYKNQYNECAWWKFKKRHKLYKSWKGALQLVLRYSHLIKN